MGRASIVTPVHSPAIPCEPLTQAHLVWRDGRPYAPEYQDAYFGSDDPSAEAFEVFIQANDLPRRFAAGGTVAIGETGFGTGLNVLLTLQQWRQHAPPGAFLSILSLEAHPLSLDDLREVHRHLDLDDADSQALCAQYPPPISGLHRIVFPGARAILTLGLGDAAPLLAQIRGGIDAWFLDGFAPRSNPGLWNTAVFRQIARLSHPGATFGTYTAAGQVRRDLEAVGFAVKRAPGHGQKRERLQGCYRGTVPDAHKRPRVAVIGAGVAGLASAFALHNRGCEVGVFDPAGAGGGASGNPAAVLLPNPHPKDTELNHLALAGMRSTRALLGEITAQTGIDPVLAEGVSFHGVSAHGRKRVQRLLRAGREHTGALFEPEGGPDSGPEPRLYYPGGCGLNLARLCTALAQSLPPVETRLITGLRLTDEGLILEAEPAESNADPLPWDHVIVATAASGLHTLCPELEQVSTVSGQMTRVRAPLPDWGGQVATGQGYCIPLGPGEAWIGATYRRTQMPDPADAAPDTTPRAEDDQLNLEHLSWIPGLGDPAQVETLERWAGTRAVVRDRLPLAGASLRDPRRRIWLNVAHGSRGLLYAPLAAELLADRLLGLPEPLLDSTSGRLDPQRPLS